MNLNPLWKENYLKKWGVTWILLKLKATKTNDTAEISWNASKNRTSWNK